MLAPIDIFDPTSYPTRRDEDWKYSDLSRVLREVPEGRILPASGVSRLDHEGWTEERFSTQGHAKIIVGSQGERELSVAAGDRRVVFEVYEGAGGYVVNATTHITLGENASLTRIVILDEPADAVCVRRTTVETAPGSTFKQYVFSTGAKFQRFETHVTHAGHGAHVEMNGAYLLKDQRHFDLTTRVTHAEIDGTTTQLIKGLVRDTATGVFQGRILVERGADGTDARMRHQALILNDGAHIRAKPELEIYADDVQCAHGNTIGALDEETLFFAMSRGIPEDAARAMLTQAFVMPVADMIEDEALRDKVVEFLAQHVEAFHGL
jgi:Fe-S cluster assembly protein SufD